MADLLVPFTPTESKGHSVTTIRVGKYIFWGYTSHSWSKSQSGRIQGRFPGVLEPPFGLQYDHGYNFKRKNDGNPFSGIRWDKIFRGMRSLLYRGLQYFFIIKDA